MCLEVSDCCTYILNTELCSCLHRPTQGIVKEVLEWSYQDPDAFFPLSLQFMAFLPLHSFCVCVCLPISVCAFQTSPLLAIQ